MRAFDNATDRRHWPPIRQDIRYILTATWFILSCLDQEVFDATEMEDVRLKKSAARSLDGRRTDLSSLKQAKPLSFLSPQSYHTDVSNWPITQFILLIGCSLDTLL